MSEEEIKNKIAELESEIDGYEDTDPAYLSESIRQLRHRIFYVHFRVERSLEILIMRAIHGSHIGKEVTEELHKQISNAWLVMEELSFYKKLRLIRKMELFNKESSLPQLIERLNKLRNEFAHPEEFSLKKFVADAKLKLETLQLLADVMRELNVIFSKFVSK